MHAEGAALAHQPVKEERGVLRHLVVLDEELLELVDHEEAARHSLGAAEGAPVGEVLDVRRAVQLAAAAQLVVQALQHAQAELAVALHGHRACVGQAARSVGLEFDALLEVHQPELHLVRRIPERGVHDQRVQERALARARLAGDERVLAGALAERHVLQPVGAAAPERYAEILGGRERPAFVGPRRDRGEGHLDAVRVLGGAADGARQPEEERVVRRGIGNERELCQPTFVKRPAVGAPGACRAPRGGDGAAAQVGFVEARGQRSAQVAQEQHVHAAARAALQDAGEALGGLVGDVHREVRHHQEPVRLGDLARLLVVRLDGGVLVAQVLLDHRLHVLGEVGQPLLDVLGVRPDAVGDQELHLVGQVHEPGKALPEANRVDEGEARLSGGNRHQDPADRVLQDPQPVRPAVHGSFNDERHPRRCAEECGDSPDGVGIGAGPSERRGCRNGVGHRADSQVHRAQADHRQRPQGRRPLVPAGRVPGARVRPVGFLQAADPVHDLGLRLLPSLVRRVGVGALQFVGFVRHRGEALVFLGKRLSAARLGLLGQAVVGGLRLLEGQRPLLEHLGLVVRHLHVHLCQELRQLPLDLRKLRVEHGVCGGEVRIARLLGGVLLLAAGALGEFDGPTERGAGGGCAREERQVCGLHLPTRHPVQHGGNHHEEQRAAQSTERPVRHRHAHAVRGLECEARHCAGCHHERGRNHQDGAAEEAGDAAGAKLGERLGERIHARLDVGGALRDTGRLGERSLPVAVDGLRRRDGELLEPCLPGIELRGPLGVGLADGRDGCLVDALGHPDLLVVGGPGVFLVLLGLAGGLRADGLLVQLDLARRLVRGGLDLLRAPRVFRLHGGQLGGERHFQRVQRAPVHPFVQRSPACAPGHGLALGIRAFRTGGPEQVHQGALAVERRGLLRCLVVGHGAMICHRNDAVSAPRLRIPVERAQGPRSSSPWR